MSHCSICVFVYLHSRLWKKGLFLSCKVKLPSACPTAASPFWFMLFFLLFFFLSLMGDDWPGSFPAKGLAAPSRASDIWRTNDKPYSVCVTALYAKLVATTGGFSFSCRTYRHFVLWWTTRKGSAEDLGLLLEATNHQTGHQPQRAWLDTAEELTVRQEVSYLYDVVEITIFIFVYNPQNSSHCVLLVILAFLYLYIYTHIFFTCLRVHNIYLFIFCCPCFQLYVCFYPPVNCSVYKYTADSEIFQVNKRFLKRKYLQVKSRIQRLGALYITAW